MKTFLFKASEIQNVRADEFRITAKWFSLSKCLTFKENNTNQSLVGLHTHYFGVIHTEIFLNLLIFEEELHWMLQKTVCWTWEFQCNMTTDKSMNVYYVPSTLVTHYGIAVIKSEISIRKCGQYLF